MPRVFRAMSREGDAPRVGNTARSLGVRPGSDIATDDSGDVSPKSGGMSVAPSWRELPPHRIPRRLSHLVPGACGNNIDFCWRLGEGAFEDSPVTPLLSLRLDRPDHGLVEPTCVMPILSFQDALAETRKEWIVDEE